MKGLLFLVFSVLILVTACKEEVPPPPDPDVLMQADSSFNAMCQEAGMVKAFLHFASDSCINLGEGSHPIIGHRSLEIRFKERGDQPLSWYPVKAVLAASGELGYTFGNWKLSLTDTSLYGNYVTIWKKQKDGSWKYLLDTGNSTPKPADSLQ